MMVGTTQLVQKLWNIKARKVATIVTRVLKMLRESQLQQMQTVQMNLSEFEAIMDTLFFCKNV